MLDTEEFSIGGAHSVRGFRENSLNGESGFFLRNEIHYHHNNNITIFTGIDIGKITRNRLNNTQQASLSGAVAGVNYRFKNINTNITIEKPINTHKNHKPSVFLTLSASF